MQPVAVTLAALDRVAERMAEIEDRAATALAFVPGDDLRLEFAGTLYRDGQCFGIAREQRLDVLFQPGKKVRIDNGTVLDDLGEPGP
jgi:hypothetical protein